MSCQAEPACGSWLLQKPITPSVRSVCMNRFFPKEKLTITDYAIAAVLITICFFGFFQSDMPRIGWPSLSFLYGNPLDFYDNAKAAMLPNRILIAYPPS